jgi:hypothetical protein
MEEIFETEDELNEQVRIRMEKLQEMQQLGKDPCVITKFDVDTSSAEARANFEKLEAENELKTQQAKDEKRDKLIRNAVEASKVVGGFGLAAWAFVASMNFEKEGTITTQGGRSALNQLLKFVKF